MLLLDRSTWNFVADFGEIVALLPAVGLGVLVLLVLGRTREALAWTACASGTVALTVLGKAALGGFPSGHASLSTIVYGGVAILAWSTRTRLGDAVAAAATALLALVVVAVYELRWHVATDIVGGLALGGVFLVVLARSIRSPVHLSEAAPALVAAALALAATHGHRLEYTLAPFALRI
jgi:hypothetical protein